MLAEFPFAVATPAAVFQRADMLWLVFDSAAKIDTAALSADASRVIRAVTLTRGTDGAAIVRIKLERPRLVSLQADGPGWIVTIGDTVTTRDPAARASPATSSAKTAPASSFRSTTRAKSTSSPIPTVGDRLLVVTALGPARGFLKAQDFVELRALPSTHGVVLQPLADDVTAELAERQGHHHPSARALAVADRDRPAAARQHILAA